jgi:hypothetical protein
MSDIILNKVNSPPSDIAPGESAISVDQATGEPQVTDGDTGQTTTFKSVFGQGVMSAKNDVPDTTTQNTPVNYLTMVTPPSLTPGVYLLMTNYYWGYSTGQRDFRAEIAVAGQIVGPTHIQEPKDTGADQMHPASPFRVLNNLGPNQAITLQYYATNNGDTARMFYAEMVLFKLSN